MQVKKNLNSKNFELLKKAKKANKYDTQKMADLLDVKYYVIRHIMQGTRLPTGHLAARIEDEFGIPTKDWFV